VDPSILEHKGSSLYVGIFDFLNPQQKKKTGPSPYWSMIPDGQAHKQKEMTNPRE